ncbi:MAG: hypothetical protein RLP02_07275, partial [Coleofasciculus sp. C2-GNP5-27]
RCEDGRNDKKVLNLSFVLRFNLSAKANPKNASSIIEASTTILPIVTLATSTYIRAGFVEKLSVRYSRVIPKPAPT